MCRSTSCHCYATDSGGWLPGPGEVFGWLAATLVRLVRAVAPVLVTVAVVWFSGHPILPRARRYARRVHVAGRLAVTAVAVGLLWTPAPTLWVVGGIGLATTAGAVVNRRRLALASRVRVQVGQPVRRQPPAAIR